MELLPKVTVLASGGLDSTACLAYFLSRKFDVSALHIAYGQAAAFRERDSVEAICKRLSIPLQVVTLTGPSSLSGNIIGRNGFLLLTALLAIQPTYPLLVAMGIHAGTAYADCSSAFVTRMQAVIDIYCDGAVRIDAPFIAWSKSDVYQSIADSGLVPLTYSCELGFEQPCDLCLSCRDIRALKC